MGAWLRTHLAPWLYRHLYRGVDERDFLSTDRAGRLCANGKPLSDDAVRGIISAAKDLEKSALFGTLLREMRQSARSKVFNEAATTEQALAARATLWTLDVLERKVSGLASMQLDRAGRWQRPQ